MNEDQKSAALPVNEEKLDPVAISILTSLTDAEPSKTLTRDSRTCIRGNAQSKSDPPDIWRRYLNAVRQQAKHLARMGRIDILRKGKPVDPNDFKGVYRLRLKADDSE